MDDTPAFDPVALGALLVPIVLAGLDRRGRKGRAWLMAVQMGVVLGVGAFLVITVVTDIGDPPYADFQAFYLPARLAAQGHNFYDPSRYLAYAPGDEPEFVEEIVNVGFWYPPPTMLLVVPLGVLPVHQAALAWFSLQLAALVACAILLWRRFFGESGWMGLLGVAASMLLLRTTFTTVDFGQTNFLALLCVLAFWRDRERAWGGVWLAIAAVIKPFTIILWAFLAVRRRWAGLAAALASLCALMLVSILAFGSETCVTYFRSNPTSRLPVDVYSQVVNSSLWGTLLRLRGLVSHPLAPDVRVEMLSAAGIVLGLTLWAASRRALDERLLFALVLTTGLMLYPVSVEHYSVLLLLPMLMLWARPETIRGGRLVLGAFATLVYFLIGTGPGWVFWAYVAIWMTLIATAARGGVTRPREA